MFIFHFTAIFVHKVSVFKFRPIPSEGFPQLQKFFTNDCQSSEEFWSNIRKTPKKLFIRSAKNASGFLSLRDCMADTLQNGVSYRSLNIIDDHNR
jgi:hypothetical protein